MNEKITLSAWKKEQQDIENKQADEYERSRQIDGAIAKQEKGLRNIKWFE